MAKDNNDYLIKTAIGLGLGFLVFKPLLEKIGLLDSAEKQQVDDMINSPAIINPFSYQYGPLLDVDAPRQKGYPTRADMWKAAKTYFETFPGVWDLFDTILRVDGFTPSSSPGYLGGTEDIAYYGELIRKAVNDIPTTNTDDLRKAFNMMQSKVSVAAVAAYLFYNYGIDLLPYIKGGNPMLPFGLSDAGNADIAAIIDYVNALPETIPGD